ncbi:MAG: branched-chain amino acid ABC transporter permease [Alphaproteobacteria bacterium]|nr:branched-chain amino acid ABC transporter permease [Alphaproteobacteria bacterium]
METVFAIGLDTVSFVLTLLLVTLGLVVIYGMMNVINMAHGELFLVGAYTLVAVQAAGGPFWLGVLLAPIVVGAIGLLIEELVIRHVYGRAIDTILATWGISLVLKQGIIVLFGPQAISVATPLPGAVQLAGIEYPSYRLLIMLVSASLAAAIYFALYLTPVGLQIRGVIANRAMAGSLGINTRLMDRGTFAIGAGLAGIAGAVMAPIMSVDPQMGVGFLIPAFLAVLVGGLNSLVGAIFGAGIIGGATTTFSSFMSQALAQILVFALAIVIIRAFPTGLSKRGR